jgi:hypothetical protein
LTSKLGRAIVCIFKELEARCSATIDPEHNSFAECGRLVLVSEFHPRIGGEKLRRGNVLNRRPGRF